LLQSPEKKGVAYPSVGVFFVIALMVASCFDLITAAHIKSMVVYTAHIMPMIV
jgi:hypothetical protein